MMIIWMAFQTFVVFFNDLGIFIIKIFFGDIFVIYDNLGGIPVICGIKY